MTCRATFHPCRSTDGTGFSVLDRKTGHETPAISEADARQIAERDYPGCLFALSTIARQYPEQVLRDVVQSTGKQIDVVIVAVLRPLDERRYAVLAHVVSSVATTSCVPFTPDVWPGIKDDLPHDHRRPRKS